MLSAIQYYIDNPEDIPDIPQASADYLAARCNVSYIQRTGILDQLRKEGFSEQALYGFCEGLSAVVEIIELMQEQRHRTEED